MTEIPTPGANGRRRNYGQICVPVFLLVPALSLVVVFFGLPLAIMLRMSLNEHAVPRLYIPGFTFRHYTEIFTDQRFTDGMLTSIGLSTAVTCISVFIGYMFALIVWYKLSKTRIALTSLALMPLLVSEISSIFGWWVFLPPNGVLSIVLEYTNVTDGRVNFVFTKFAAIAGMVYVTFPYCFFIVLSVFDSIDRRVVEASADLFAKPVRTLTEVLLPLTGPGLLLAAAQSFIFAMGTYATPSALGPDGFWTIGFLIQEQMLGKANWPRASALAIVLISIVAAGVFVIGLVNRRRPHFHE